MVRFIADGHLDRHLRRTRKIYRERHQLVSRFLDQQHDLGHLKPAGMNYAGLHITAFITNNRTENEIAAEAATRGIALTRLSECWMNPTETEGLMIGFGNIAVDVWSKTHMVADALGKLGADKAAAIDSAGLVAAVTGAGPITRPEFTPLDFSKPAFPENPVLSALRIFSRSATVVRVDKGTYKSVAPFGDVTKPFQLKTG